MSRKRRLATIPSFQIFSTWKIRRKSADSVDLSFLKPMWISCKRFSFSASSLSLAAVIASISFPIVFRKAIEHYAFT